MNVANLSDVTELQAKAGEAARLLRLLGNEKRLLMLCHLAVNGEMTVGALSDAVRLSQSALSQHLARLRADRLVTYRRESQVLFYRVQDPKAARLLMALKEIFCPELG